MSEPGRTPTQAHQWRLIKEWAHEDTEVGAMIREILYDVAYHWSHE